jgi:hypothetical protein
VPLPSRAPLNLDIWKNSTKREKPVTSTRSNLYASEEIKRKLLDVVQLLGRGNLSLTAYVDNILRHHLEFYREEINRLHKQRNSQNIL